MGLNKKQQRVVDELDRRVKMSEEFMGDWRRLNQVIAACRNPAVDKSVLQRELESVKIKLARSHGVLKETLQADYTVDANTNIMNILYTIPDTQSLASGQSEVAYKKIQGECNRAEMSLHEMLGRLQNKKTRAMAGDKIFLMPTGGMQPKALSTEGFLSEKVKKNLMIVAGLLVLAAIIYFVPPLRNLYIGALKDFGILPQ